MVNVLHKNVFHKYLS